MDHFSVGCGVDRRVNIWDEAENPEGKPSIDPIILICSVKKSHYVEAIFAMSVVTEWCTKWIKISTLKQMSFRCTLLRITRNKYTGKIDTCLETSSTKVSWK